VIDQSPKIEVDIYTDGSCSGPRTQLGGWGAVLYFPDRPAPEEICGCEQRTSPIRMELIAAIRALERLPTPSVVRLYTDCPAVHSGLSGWLKFWKSRGWRTSNWKRLAHWDLWKRLDRAAVRHSVTCIRVRAHAGIQGNIRADHLARQARTALAERIAPARVKAQRLE